MVKVDITSIIVSLISAIATTICAYIAIVPQIKKSQIKAKDIEKAIENSPTIKDIKDVLRAEVKEGIENSRSLRDIKAGLKSEMRKSLIEQYWKFEEGGFNLTQVEKETWKEDFEHYTALGGNGVIVELDTTLALAKKRFLIVEDNNLSRCIEMEVLKRYSAEVDIVSDGTFALKEIEKHEPGYYDVILLDVNLPKLDGYQTAEKIRKMTDYQKGQLKIIAISACPIDTDKCIDFDGYCRKPLEISELVSILK